MKYLFILLLLASCTQQVPDIDTKIFKMSVDSTPLLADARLSILQEYHGKLDFEVVAINGDTTFTVYSDTITALKSLVKETFRIVRHSDNQRELISAYEVFMELLAQKKPEAQLQEALKRISVASQKLYN